MNTFSVEWMHLDLGFAVTPSAELFPFKNLKGEEEGEESPSFFPSPFPPPPLEPPSPCSSPGLPSVVLEFYTRRRFATEMLRCLRFKCLP